MKDALKTRLSELGLFDKAKAIKNKLTEKTNKSKNEKILHDELAYSSTALSPTSFDSLSFSIRMQIHSIEKALVKGDTEKINKFQLLNLLDKAQKVINLFPEYNKDADLIVETLGIIKTASGCIPEKEEIEQIYDDFVVNNGLQNIEPHIIKIKNVDKSYITDWKTAEEFISCRHSVRTFSDKPVEYSLISEITELASKCPSACNRQPWKVYYTEEFEKTEKLKPNPAVTKDINYFLIVTVNKNMFSSSELMQAWINGGIFLESLVLAIHAKGLASCLFQEIKGTKQYASIKSVAGIPENEDIVALVGFGYPEDEFPVIETHRKSVEEILVKF